MDPQEGPFRRGFFRWLLVATLALALAAAAWQAFSSRHVLAPEGTATITRVTTVAGMLSEEELTRAREWMVLNTIQMRGVRDENVLNAMRTLPRHEFVPADLQAYAYNDHPLPIGYGQTISQPYIVAWMTELLALNDGERVLEIGTGSGYQAAVLESLGLNLEIYTIEIIPELAESAAARLQRPGLSEIHVRQGDGYYGWPEAAPFDAILVTAAPDHLPPPLAKQLAPGGRLVIPIGPPGGYQMLWKFVNESDGLKAYELGGVSFVPFTGEGVQSTVEPTARP